VSFADPVQPLPASGGFRVLICGSKCLARGTSIAFGDKPPNDHHRWE